MAVSEKLKLKLNLYYTYIHPIPDIHTHTHTHVVPISNLVEHYLRIYFQHEQQTDKHVRHFVVEPNFALIMKVRGGW